MSTKDFFAKITVDSFASISSIEELTSNPVANSYAVDVSAIPFPLTRKEVDFVSNVKTGLDAPKNDPNYAALRRKYELAWQQVSDAQISDKEAIQKASDALSENLDNDAYFLEEDEIKGAMKRNNVFSENGSAYLIAKYSRPAKKVLS